jgi:predicted ABC-type transport system involved in lysophospholipase L1 biosynthesis ATPase subunit
MPPLGPPPKGALLSARGLRKSFRIGDRRLEVLHGIDLDVAPGERMCIMGASGAGKTTLLNILGLLDHPTEGEVRLQGRDAWRLTPLERARLRNATIGFVFQFYHLLPELDAVENVLLPAMIANSGREWRRRRKELREGARTMLADFGLSERMDHRPSQLSGGEQQRVAMARALILGPSLVIADEPTGNLDRATGDRVLDLLLNEQRRRGVAMILVTHDERLAARAGRVVYVEDGLVQADTSLPIPQ